MYSHICESSKNTSGVALKLTDFNNFFFFCSINSEEINSASLLVTSVDDISGVREFIKVFLSVYMSCKQSVENHGGIIDL